jgi:hypothetical protein
VPFREKSAWISFLVVLGVFGPFFAAVALGRIPTGGMATVHYLLLSVLAVVVLQTLLHVAAALLARGDAGTPKDERERLIELKATSLAYMVLIVGVLGGLFVLLHTPLYGAHPGAPDAALTVLCAVVLADLVKSAATIVHYRLGA